MALEIKTEDIEKFIMVGDRVLIKPKQQNEKTSSGLYLPPGVKEKEKVHEGYIIKVGPGYPVPSMKDFEDEPWKKNEEEVKYISLQAKEGDLAVYMKNNAYDIQFNNEKYVVIPHSAILFLLRDKGLFE